MTNATNRSIIVVQVFRSLLGRERQKQTFACDATRRCFCFAFFVLSTAGCCCCCVKVVVFIETFWWLAPLLS